VTETADTAELEPQVSAELVTRIGAGDHSAEEEMVLRYSRGLLYLLRRRTRDEALARDIRQDAFCIALKNLRRAPLNNPESLAAYLRGTAIKLLSADYRKTVRHHTDADSELIARTADEGAGPFENVSQKQVARAVRALLEELRVPRDREILVRLYLRDEDRDTICKALGIDAEHFTKVLFRAKGRFRTLLEREEQKGKLRLVG